MAFVWVFIGSALGGVTRYWVSGMAARVLGPSFPWGTLIVNISGSMLIGALATVLSGSDSELLADARLFTMVGICGGYTTISSFSLQTLNLALEGEWLPAGLNVLGSVALCLIAAGIGHLVAIAFFL